MADVVGGAGQAPGNVTYGSLTDEIIRFVSGPTDDPELRAIAQDGILEAIRQLNSRTWEWVLSVTDITLVAGTAEYDIPDNFHQPRSAAFVNSDDKAARKVNWLEPKMFQDHQAWRGSTGTNRYYTVFNRRDDQKVKLAGDVDAGWASSYPELRLRYYRYIQYPTSESAALDLVPEAESFVSWFGKAYTAGIHEPRKEPAATLRADRAWKRLVKDNNLQRDF